jgi:hypothetical protein
MPATPRSHRQHWIVANGKLARFHELFSALASSGQQSAGSLIRKGGRKLLIALGLVRILC